jgi:hypothetical protein
MPVEHSPNKIVTRSQSLRADKTKKTNGNEPIHNNKTAEINLNIVETKVVSPLKLSKVKISPELSKFNIKVKPNIAKMSTSLTEIAKFAKLVGDYDVDNKGVSIRSHFSRLETLAVIGQWTNEVKISVVICTIRGRAFDFISDNQWTEYNNLKSALIGKFDSLDDVASLTTQLFHLKQESASIREHATSFDIILNKLKSIGAVPLSPQTLLNVFLNGLLFKYKRDILLQGISTYDEALKRAVLVERLDKVDTVERVVARVDCIQSSALPAIKLEEKVPTNIYDSIESSIVELTKSVANLSLRDS